VDQALTQILNLLLESERAGVAALDALIPEVAQDELRKLLTTSREDEAATAARLEALIRAGGETPSAKVGDFAIKVAAAGSLQERLKLLIHGEERVARTVEEAMALAPASGAVHQQLQQMANRHRFEVEWGRAELIRLMNTIG
jgi:N-methylhydantoinase B/oxoprolinase/acetone carboxylase alpha subunit